MLQKIKTKNILITMAALLVLFGLGGYIVFADNDRAATVGQIETVDKEEKQTTVESIVYKAEQGVSVLEQLRQVATVETKESSFGTLVDSINGVVNGTDGKYWLFYVDGQMADKGADMYISEGGETIEWKFSK